MADHRERVNRVQSLFGLTRAGLPGVIAPAWSLPAFVIIHFDPWAAMAWMGSGFFLLAVGWIVLHFTKAARQ